MDGYEALKIGGEENPAFTSEDTYLDLDQAQDIFQKELEKSLTEIYLFMQFFILTIFKHFAHYKNIAPTGLKIIFFIKTKDFINIASK